MQLSVGFGRYVQQERGRSLKPFRRFIAAAYDMSITFEENFETAELIPIKQKINTKLKNECGNMTVTYCRLAPVVEVVLYEYRAS